MLVKGLVKSVPFDLYETFVIEDPPSNTHSPVCVTCLSRQPSAFREEKLVLEGRRGLNFNVPQ